MARKGTADLQKAKAAKQKKIAIVGFVLLLGIMAFQGPRTLKMLKGPEAARSAAACDDRVDADRRRPGAAAGHGRHGGAHPRPDGRRHERRRARAGRGAARLVHPLREQGSVRPADRPGRDRKHRPAAAAAKGSSSGAKSGGGGGSSSGSSSSAGGGSKPEAATKATLVVNGVREEVAVGGEFPKDGPYFVLVAVGPSSARIGIAGGSYASGEQTAVVARARRSCSRTPPTGRATRSSSSARPRDSGRATTCR